MNSNDSDITENISISDIIQSNSNDSFKTVKTYSHNDKKLLVKRIGDIKNKKCYIKIFKIIHGDNFKYTKNDNGVFFNLTNLPDSVLAKIETVLVYYENRKNQNEQIMMKTNNVNSIFTEDSDMISTSERYNNSTQATPTQSTIQPTQSNIQPKQSTQSI